MFDFNQNLSHFPVFLESDSYPLDSQSSWLRALVQLLVTLFRTLESSSRSLRAWLQSLEQPSMRLDKRSESACSRTLSAGIHQQQFSLQFFVHYGFIYYGLIAMLSREQLNPNWLCQGEDEKPFSCLIIENCERFILVFCPVQLLRGLWLCVVKNNLYIHILVQCSAINWVGEFKDLDLGYSSTYIK